jgi:IS30 family transposase
MEKSKTWRQLNQGDRDRIQLLWKQGEKQVDIAEILEVHPSRISREIAKRKKQDGTYSATVAHHKAQVLRSNSKYQGMKIEQNSFLRKHIITELKVCRSPDEIAGKMIVEGWTIRVSSDAIYRWLRSAFGQRYCKYLCTKRCKKKPQTGKKRHVIPNMISIHNIPENAGVKTEGDTMLSPKKVSKKSAVLVVWKESKLLKGDIVKSLRPIHTTRVMKKIHTENKSDLMILDQGIENGQHEQFGIPTYFCDPASPRQKPLIESSIGLVRRWFYPKGTDLSKVSSEEFKEKLEILNNKYRKTLQYRSANEVARECGILRD